MKDNQANEKENTMPANDGPIPSFTALLQGGVQDPMDQALSPLAMQYADAYPPRNDTSAEVVQPARQFGSPVTPGGFSRPLSRLIKPARRVNSTGRRPFLEAVVPPNPKRNFSELFAANGLMELKDLGVEEAPAKKFKKS